MTTAQPFRLALTADFYDSNGALQYRDIGLYLFESESQITYDAFNEHRPEIGTDQLAGVNAVIVLTPKVSAATLSHLSRMSRLTPSAERLSCSS